MNCLRKMLLTVTALSMTLFASASDLDLLPEYVSFELPTASDASGYFKIADQQTVSAICIDAEDWEGVRMAVIDMASDIEKVTGKAPVVNEHTSDHKACDKDGRNGGGCIIVGTIGKSKLIDQLVKDGSLDVNGIEGQWESFVIQTIDGNLVIAGSDKRGTIYGAYNLSENIGVSPWYYWADVPVWHQDKVYVANGRYVMPSPKVKYRGLFLNDEAPCLTSWVKNTFGTNYGGKDFYQKVFELILRLRGNYLWPAMWQWAFYADDPENSDLADKMGVIMGTSHHEPMARNHQEWARHRSDYGAWDYNTNQKVIDQFFTEGVERIKNKEDIITIGMRGDGDTGLGGKEGHDHEYQSDDERNLHLLEKIIRNQRKIIKKVTGQAPEKHPQLWALYKEVQKYYEMGLKVPDDVIILLADDNWGDVRRLPNAQERKHPGGWGMYYHVDYVGAPRNSKWLNVTPIQNMWEQLSLTYEYGVDKLWILNVGDLKPMEYPITLFMDIAWAPEKFTAQTLMQHPLGFCNQIFGEPYGKEAAEILNLYSKYNGRVTPEMLDASTYNLETGEWRQVRDDYMTLETHALRLYNELPQQSRDAYKQLILFPVQAMANLYDMYYSQAMNHKLYLENDPSCNYWAERVQRAFDYDAHLMHDYNKVMAGGKWNGMMTQKHIGYTTWNDNFPKDIMPEVRTIDRKVTTLGGYTYLPNKDGVIVMEAQHCNEAINPDDAQWTVITDMGRTLSGVTLMPRQAPREDAALKYVMSIPEGRDSVDVHVILKSTLPFERTDGHRFAIGFDGQQMQEVNFNGHLNDQKTNPYVIFYPTVARRIIDAVVTLPLGGKGNEQRTLTIEPIDAGAVFEKIIVDFGGYEPTYLMMDESAGSYKN